ncbi:hypothetical protein GCM10027275_00880 [Rhabdobacter roseus]|uniref:Aerotolerance regulator N-terminal domain-containing protein n=1 Tax=Rhabdobacter roseus TaxID=1655419 RepID=A0A840TK92_9BACT|nr:BatA domain-containing protein [Rhabdobacter roseus]MBB5281972.1 hypothetical protein [Rhabdobacter roseus]
MEFLQPYLLWGTLAVAIPVVIHLWHQKKGTVLAWAATQWLSEKNQQPRRGLRLDQLLLLLLRCLLIVLLALLLSEPFFSKESTASTPTKIHLVQPDAFLTDNFRFELEEALKKGEALYWIAAPPQAAEALSPLPTSASFSPQVLQAALNTFRSQPAELHLYLLNNRPLAAWPRLEVPAPYQLHTAFDSLTPRPIPYWALDADRALYIQDANRLEVASTPTGTGKPVHEGELRVLLADLDPEERTTLEAALRALAEVYTLPITVHTSARGEAKYDLIFTQKIPNPQTPATLYIVTGEASLSTQAARIHWPERLTPEASALVASGQLPEWIGQQLLSHWGLAAAEVPLSTQELNTLFVAAPQSARPASALPQGVLWLVFLGVLWVERWLALTRNA